MVASNKQGPDVDRLSTGWIQMGRAGTPQTGMQAVQCRWWPGSLSVVDTRFHAVHALRALGSRCGSPHTTGPRRRPHAAAPTSHASGFPGRFCKAWQAQTAAT